MTVTSPFQEAAQNLKSVIDAEFAVEGYSANYDKLHESLGADSVEIGIYPEDESANSGDMQVQDSIMYVQFFDIYELKVDPAQQVNPIAITTKAERFRRAVSTFNKTRVGNARSWYFDITRVLYPDDPTGNKTRFVATIRAKGNNSGLIETVG